MTDTLKLAIIGDVHLHFNERDVEYFNASDYNALLFVGDLINYRGSAITHVTDSLRSLTLPSMIIPGNHDCGNVLQLVAELFQSELFRKVTSFGHRAYEEKLRSTIGSVEFAGYSRHQLLPGTLDLIAVRPYSMGGPRLSFGPHLRTQFGVGSLDDSILKLKALVDESDAAELIFMGHNGPSGLGATRSDIWGCDFKKEEGDFGDPDYKAVIEYARSKGKRVRAVIGGHMHRHLKGGGKRTWQLTQNDTLYVNAANVPRIRHSDDGSRHHHVELTIGEAVECTEHWIEFSN